MLFRSTCPVQQWRMALLRVRLSQFHLHINSAQIKSQKMFPFLFGSHQQQHLHVHILVNRIQLLIWRKLALTGQYESLFFSSFIILSCVWNFKNTHNYFMVYKVAKTFCPFKGSANVKTKKKKVTCGCLGLTLHGKCNKWAIKRTKY